MEFRLLGEVQLRAAGQLLEVGGPRLQAVLAALAVDAGRPVAIETLIDRVWDDTPPVEARNVVYSYMSRIRRLLKQASLAGATAVRIERRHAGYVLDIDPDLVDLHRFRGLVDQGRDPRRGDPARAAAIAEALGLWRGPPLAGLPGQWAGEVRNSWHRQRLDAVVHWAQIELRLGHPAAVLTTLPDLADEYPLVEPLETLLMRALHAAGRSAEALDRYTGIRRRLADELGTDPGPELRALHQAVLLGELPLPPPDPIAAAPRTVALPAQLPADTSGFTGRGAELRRLDGLSRTAGDRSTAVVISAVSGTAGVGKTALAVHWAHRKCQEFPDGQLYVNLRGFDPTGSPLTPAEAMRGFLDAFEVPAERIPTTFDAQVGLYRSLLSGRRVLAVLDNARDAEQVRPLLPGAPGCMVVVTSRNQLTGLVTEGAHPLPLDLLPTAEARELLVCRLGARRVAAEPHAVDEIIALCARLPLALSIVAARAATHPGFGLAVLAGELRQTRGGLDEFAGTDPATDARAAFSWSYRQLSPDAARLFRLLGLHPGPDITAPAAASLTGRFPPQARTLLAELAQAHLIVEHTPGRYTFHDLLRAYATEQAHIIDTDDQRHAAIHRTLDHYLHTAHTAVRLLAPARDPLPLAPPQPGVTPENPADHRQAMAWFTAEHAVLLATVVHTAATGWDTHTWQLAWTITVFLDRRGHWQDNVAIQRAALTAIQRLADPSLRARAHRYLGRAYAEVARFDEADTHLQYALDLHRQCGDPVGQAYTHCVLGVAVERQGRHTEALAHASQALELFRAAGHRLGRAQTLKAIGWCHAMLGDHQQALTFCQQALPLLETLGDRRGQARTWDSLGYAHHHLGHHTRAITCYHHAIALCRDLGDHFREAISFARLGDTHHAIGDPDHARDAWQAALTTLDQLDHPYAEQIRTKLRHLDHAPTAASNTSHNTDAKRPD
jgi:DNA-binding SARP family transcriptional activator/tetratricopeptide (TPR) repeat protein